MASNPFYPEMTHFALPLHATREELVELAARWAAEHELHVSLERWHPAYGAAAPALGADLGAAIEAFEPVRRICLRSGPFDIGAVTQGEHLARNPEALAVVLEPLTEDGLRATALTLRMGDERKLRWWIGLVRAELENLHVGASASGPGGGGRMQLPGHCHTPGAHALAADGVAMLAAAGTARFAFDDLA